MSFWDKVHVFFETAKWRREESQRVMREHFQGYDPVATLAVLHCLVETLGVPYHLLRPETSLPNDLGADEDEPYEISLDLTEEHGLDINYEQVYEAYTVGNLILLVTRLFAEKNTRHASGQA